MNRLDMQYALAKQLPTVKSLLSDYGEMELDDELRQAVEKALTPIIQRRLNPAEDSRELEKPMELPECRGFFDRIIYQQNTCDSGR
ncbi:MAG: hypothetical protein MI862_26555 [Desulfobacterales bacterium]|nr:hypothetical protein [Desulfobacterales bacterium]